MKPFGVRMINIDFYPLLGGAQTHTLRLCHYLQSQGVDVEVITRQYPGLARRELVEGVPVYRTPIMPGGKVTAAFSFVFFALLHLAVDRKHYSVIHSHEMLSPMTIGLLARELLGAKLVVMPHRSGYLGDVWKLTERRPLTGRLRIAWAAHRSHAFISISRPVTSELLSVNVPGDKIHLIPYGLDTNYFTPATPQNKAELRQSLGLLPDATWCIYTGRMVPEKGLDLLLSAWDKISATHPEARLLLVGDGEERAHLEEMAGRPGLRGSIRFTGSVNDTAPYLRAADLYIQPSFTEGLPVAMLEAMACGLPIVATAVGGIPDLINEHSSGLLIPPHEEGRLQNAIDELLSSPDLRSAMGAQARLDVSSIFSLQTVGQANLDLYHQIMGGNQSQTGSSAQ